MLRNKIRREKKRILDQKHRRWKKHETQSLTNQTLKDEIEKKTHKRIKN